MTLKISLPDRIEKQLELEAQHSGLSLEQYSAQILVRHLEEVQKRQNAVAILESWTVGDAVEQAATGEELVRLLEQDRLSARRLFPDELKGVTW